MPTNKATRPHFQSVELDPIDQRLEEKAVEKGIPTLVTPEKVDPSSPRAEAQPVAPSAAVVSRGADPPSPEVAEAPVRIMSVNLEVPDYVWIAVKTRAAQKMISLRHFTLMAYRAQGIEIRDEDMHEDGRRLRGGKSVN